MWVIRAPEVGDVVDIVTDVPAAAVVAFCLMSANVSSPATLYEACTVSVVGTFGTPFCAQSPVVSQPQEPAAVEVYASLITPVARGPPPRPRWGPQCSRR